MPTPSNPNPSIQTLVGPANGDYTEQVGYKFFADGRPKAFAGNTFLCHIPRPSAAFDALVELQTTLRASPEAQYLSYLPPESFHMTVFQGVNDAERSAAQWPRDLALETPLEAVTEHFKASLRQLDLPTSFTVRPTHLRFAQSLRLVGADAAEEAKLRQVRDSLARALHYRAPNHDSYGFHITLAYRIRYMSAEEARRILALADIAYQEFASCVSEIELGRLEFCQFSDMHAFVPQL